jgi:tetratricopeptide (TPR) repeat protein
MVRNYPYQYLYFNELVGGIRGANGNYDNDYYFTAQTEASEWLIEYLKSNDTNSAIIGATYPVDWQFRHYPEYQTFYMRNEERSQFDWDYAIITNRYIPADRLKNENWPPADALHTITVEGVPVCTVLKRKTKNDYLGFNALQSGNALEAVTLFSAPECSGLDDELFFYNFAQALRMCGLKERSDSVISIALSINPDYEPLLMYCGNIALAENDPEKAKSFYEKVIELNPKYFQAYTELAKIYSSTSKVRGRELLRRCLTINPGYTPAIKALAETYRESDPEIARKYDELAEKMN